MPTAVAKTPRAKTPVIAKSWSNMQIINREHWLQGCGENIAPHIEIIAGKHVPDFLISVSLPTRRGLSKTKRVIGQCIPLEKEGKKSHLFISPVLGAMEQVAGTVAHELVHTLALGHGREFGAIARPLGLVGKLTETTAGEDFFALTDSRGRTLRERLLKLGPYPHEAIDLTNRKAAPTLMLKCVCDSCGFIFRTTEKWIKSDVGLPKCNCGGQFIEAKKGAKKPKKKGR